MPFEPVLVELIFFTTLFSFNRSLVNVHNHFNCIKTEFFTEQIIHLHTGFAIIYHNHAFHLFRHNMAGKMLNNVITHRSHASRRFQHNSQLASASGQCCFFFFIQVVFGSQLLELFIDGVTIYSEFSQPRFELHRVSRAIPDRLLIAIAAHIATRIFFGTEQLECITINTRNRSTSQAIEVGIG